MVDGRDRRKVMAQAAGPGTSTQTAAADRYDRMAYRAGGASGLRLPAISLGLWQNFSDDRQTATQRAIVRHAFDRGIIHFDLGNNYGSPYGSAGANFGRILASDLRPYRGALIISTKAGYDMWPGPYGDGTGPRYSSPLHLPSSQSLGSSGALVACIQSDRRSCRSPGEGLAFSASAVLDGLLAGRSIEPAVVAIHLIIGGVSFALLAFYHRPVAGRWHAGRSVTSSPQAEAVKGSQASS